MLRRVALVRADVSEELSPSIFRVTRIGEIGTTLTVVPDSPILVSLMIEVLCSFETSVITRATRRHIPEDAILQKITQFRALDFLRFSSEMRNVNPSCRRSAGKENVNL
jgi:hypothetical protein